MPALDVSQDTTQQTQTQTPDVAQQPANNPLEQSVAGMNYQDGQDALSPKKEEQADPEARKKAFEKALGGLIGGPLFDLIHEHLSTDKLNEYGKEGIGALAGAASSLPTDKLGEAGPGAEKLAELALEWASKKAETWLQGEKGQAFIKAINDYVEEHPWVMASTAVAGALIGAIVLVGQNYDPKAFSTDFKLGKNLKASVGADIGPIQDLCLQGANLGLAYHKDRYEASLKGGWKQTEKDGQKVNTVTAGADLTVGNEGEAQHKAGINGEVSDQGDKKLAASYKYTSAKDDKGTPLTVSANAGATVNAAGDLSIDVGAALEAKNVKFDVKSSGATPKEQVTEASLSLAGEKDYKLTGKYDNASKKVDLGLKRSWEESGLSIDQYLGTDGTSLNMGMKKDNYDLKGGFNANDQGATGNMGFNANQGGWTVASFAELDLDASQLNKVSSSLGYKDENEAKSFVLDWSRQWATENGSRVSKDAFKAALKSSIAGVAVGISGGLDLKNGKVDGASASLSLSKDTFKSQLDFAMSKNTLGSFDTKGSLSLSGGKEGFSGLKLDYDHALDAGNNRYKTTLGATGATDFGGSKFGLAGNLSASTYDGKNWDAKAGAVGSYDVGHNTSLLMGGEYERVNNRDRWTAKAGVAVKGVPITINYTPQNKEVSVGVSMTFDQIKSIFK